MRAVVVFLTVTLNLVLQSTIFGYIEIIDTRPNTAILIIVSYAILRGDIGGALLGFTAGLLQDIFFSNTIGIHALMYMIIGYYAGKPFKNFFHENYFLSLFLSSIAIFAYGLVFYLINSMQSGGLDFFYYLGNIILPETVYTIALAIPVYLLVYAINSQLEKSEKMKRKLFSDESDHK